MQFPESWLREFCNPDLSTQQLAESLTMAGLEVEDIHPAAPAFSGIVVAEIVEAQQHPNADRLRVCKVNTGGAESLTIVCGAPNARAGIKVPCAVVGAILPAATDSDKPLSIKVGKLRGVESSGMLCSARELGISQEHGGLLELPADAPIGLDIRQYLSLDDSIFTLKLTPNLGHCLSVYGVAREVAAITGAPLTRPATAAAEVVCQDRLSVNVEAKDLCGRFSGRIIRNVNHKATTPAWMVQRLARCGQRSVSALVDISNYVMFEYGQPTHIFDLDKIHGSLHVRWACAGEQLDLLNGNTVSLNEAVGVIADDRAVESLAGVMGGEATAVSDATRNIYVEAAFWWPEAIAARARRFNFSTDAAHRFERGVDPALTVDNIERITRLIIEICGGEPGLIDDQPVNMPASREVRLRVARAAKVIGMPLTQAQCVDALNRLGLPLREGEGTITVTPPSYRFDLRIEEDLIEEVARLVGYNNLPLTPVTAPIVAKACVEERRSTFAVRHMLAGLGYQETINYSFVEEPLERDLAGNADPIRLLNPIASPMGVMRSSLLGSLLNILRYNLDRKASRVRIFELGRVFMRDDGVASTDTTVKGIHQPMRVAGLAFGTVNALQWSDQAQQRADFYDVKGDVQALLAPEEPVFERAQHPAMHPGRCARIYLRGQPIGFLGELHPRWRQVYGLPNTCAMFELELDAVLQRKLPQPQPIPKFQNIERDLAVVVRDQIDFGAVQAAIKESVPAGMLRGLELFDVYRPGATQGGAGLAVNEKSMAVRLSFNSDNAVLSDEQINQALDAVTANLARKCGARLRA